MIVAASLGTVSARAADESPAGTTEGTTHVAAKPPALELIPQLSILSPASLILRSPDFVVPYNESFAGLPAVHVGLAAEITSIGSFDLSAIGRIGLAAKANAVNVQPTSGSARSADVSLLWMPLSASARVVYNIPGVEFFRPVLELGGGVNYLRQSSRVPGLSADFWVPFLFATPGMTFGGGIPGKDWFGGFTFGASIQESISSIQTIRGWSFDLSVNIFL